MLSCGGGTTVGFKVMLFNVDISHGGGLEAFEEEACKIFSCDAVKILVILALVQRILDVFEEVFLGIYDQ